MVGFGNTDLNINRLLCLCSGEGADDAFGSSTREADRQPIVLRGNGAGTQSVKSIRNRLIFFRCT